MLKKLISFIFIAALFLISTGCANRATAKLTAGTDLTKVKNFYIVETEEYKDTSNLIKANLEKRGLKATTGPEMKLPYNSDAVITSTEKWMWDITTYMLELTIDFRDPTNNFPMAVGNSMHTSLTRKSPEEMVDEVLTNIFNAKL